jgi:hypothetical protein
VTRRPRQTPGAIAPPCRIIAGRSRRASASAAAGAVLSQPTRQTYASNACARPISSIESAMTSRLTRDARIPGVPMVMLSLTAMVLNSSGVPPAARTPAATAAARSRSPALHGMVPVQVFAMPTIGRRRSSSERPMAR